MSGLNTPGKRPPRISDSYEAFPRQEQFHESKAKYRLFGGAAGPGKTKALLFEAIRQALEVGGCDTLLLRRTYPELESSLIAYFRRDVPRSWYKSYNESKHIVTWDNGSTTKFGHCRNENDVYQYQGAEFLFIGIDELTHFTYKQWQFLTSRNRCPARVYSDGKNAGKRIVPCMAGATNPGNIGHAWVKALWIDKQPPAAFDRPELYNPDDYEFIRARIDDNPIYANDVEYRRSLEALPEHLRRAFLDGDCNVFAGQYFSNFEYGRHTARPEEIHLEPWWPRWISIDWGFQHPSAVYWHCAAPTAAYSRQFTADSNKQDYSTSEAVGCQLSAVGPSHQSPATSHQSRIVTFREFVQNNLSPRMLAQAIAERSGRENISEVFLSPDAFAQRTSETSIAEQLGDVLAVNGLPRPTPADDDRVGGWQWMYQLLQDDAWLISEDCPELIECLPELVRDDDRHEDIRKMEGDDSADSARYGLVSGARIAGFGTGWMPSRAGQAPPFHFPSGAPHFVHGMPVHEQIMRQINATDPTSRAIHYQRLESDAKRFFRPAHLPRRRRW